MVVDFPVMKNQALVLRLRTLLYVLMLIGSAACYEGIWDDPSVVFNHNRFPEIEKHCSPYLTSATEIKPDDSRSYRLKNELSFFNGDWEQVNGGAPLMPFDDSDIPKDSFPSSPPLKLVSFEVKNVNPVHHSKNSVSLGGIMNMFISRKGSIDYIHGWYSKFYMVPGLSVLPIVFEGVYIETEDDGGERLLCLIGNSTLPSRNRLDDSLDLANKYGLMDNDLPHVMPDARMLLVLRYPKIFNLSKRAIRGEIRSLDDRQSFTYFDKVSISALLGPYWKYQFHPDLLQSRTCSTVFYQDEMIEDGVQVFNGSGFCRFLSYVSRRKFNVMPNYNFKARGNHNSKLDSILFEKEFATVGLNYENAHLILQHVKCVPDTTCDNNHCGAAKVFAVLRAIHAEMLQQEAESMTGLSGLTITAEGVWTSSSRQLCMVGCLGESSSGLERCHSQISLYFPLTLSIRQRSLIVGSISSFDKESGSYFPLIFDSSMHPRGENDYYCWYGPCYLSYNYSMINRVRASRNGSLSSKVLGIMKQLFLRYPALKDRGEFLNCLDHLSADLHINAYALLNSPFSWEKLRIFTQLEVVSLGPLFGHYNHARKSYINERPANLMVKFIDHQLLNVSLHMTFRKAAFGSQVSYNNVSELFLEGLYDPLAGEMHLIGCKKVDMHLYGGTDVERGLDCLIEVKVQYPPENTQWLKNSMAKMKITSLRNEDDPLHFNSISLQALTGQRRDILEDVAFRKSFERIVRILVLTVMIRITWSQLSYMKKEVDTKSNVSLAMFAIQVLVYSLPLISNAEILFKSREIKFNDNIKYRLERYQLSFDVLDNVGRLLLLCALLLNASMFQLVFKHQNKQQQHHGYATLVHVPSVKRILLCIIAIYIFGLLSIDHILLQFGRDMHSLEAASMFRLWNTKIEDFVNFAQDLFLLPQVLENFLWQINVAPLRKVYYIGLTLMRLILHMYDFVRDPILDPYSEDAEIVGMNLSIYSNIGSIAVSVTVITLAVIVHVQQSLNLLKISKWQNSG
ncbi:hypothetical protein PTKIN_Ptkin03bG0254000 [Pterospermum kingtungense]